MSDEPKLYLGQIWTYVTTNSYAPEAYDETIQLTAKDIQGLFEYKTLFGKRTGGPTIAYTEFARKVWVLDPEAKGSQYWRDLRDSK